jgi:uroporphyrinogen-III synthase
MRVVVTRPLDRAQATAAALRGMGHEPFLLPLSEARHLTDQMHAMFSHAYPAIALTSAEALRAVSGFDMSSYLNTPLFAVGHKTAAAVREAGFKTILVADGDGASLAALIAEHAPAEVVYLTGRPRSPTFETALAAAGIPLKVVECYEMVPLKPSPDELSGMLSSPPDAILFHSREAARLFFELPAVLENPAAFAARVIACLSPRVAEIVPSGLRDRVKVAARPDETSLLALL